MMQHIPYCSLANSELASERILVSLFRGVFSAYLCLLRIAQLGIRICAASWRWIIGKIMIPGFHNILHVFGAGSGFKMLKIGASLVVSMGTFVEHVKSFWNRASKQNPSDSCGLNRRVILFPTAHYTVPMTKHSRPNPTASLFIDSDFGHESLWRCWGQSLTSKINGVSVWLIRIVHSDSIPRSRLFTGQREGNFIMPLAGLNAN